MSSINPELSKTANGAPIIALEEHGYYLEIQKNRSSYSFKINDWNSPKRSFITSWKRIDNIDKFETSQKIKDIRDALKKIYGDIGYTYGKNRILMLIQEDEDRWEVDDPENKALKGDFKRTKIDLITETVLNEQILLFVDQHKVPHILISVEKEDLNDANDKNDNNDNVSIIVTPPESIYIEDIHSREDKYTKTSSFSSLLSQKDMVNKIYPLNSRFVARYISSLIWEKFNFAPASKDINAVRLVLGGVAQENETIPLYNRVAEDKNGNWWIDLSNDNWGAIKITDNDWSIENPPILFKRYSHQAPLYKPIKNGDPSHLLDYIKLVSVDSQLLWLVDQISFLVPGIPHPPSIIWGGKGTIKTTAQDIVKKLIDNSHVGLVSMPNKNKPNELIQILDHHYLCGFDNVSSVDDSQSDIICRGITGGGQSKRALYTDDEDFTRSFIRCVSINGISLVIGKPDLSDRSLVHETDSIPKTARKQIKKIMEDFDKKAPSILGGILDVLVKARQIVKRLNIESLNRMADFTLWGCAITEALGISHDKFLIAYNQNISSQEQEVVRSLEVGYVLEDYLNTRLSKSGSSVTFTPMKLYNALVDHADTLRIDTKSQSFPKDHKALGRKLNELIPNLPSIGFSCKRDRTGDRRKITFSTFKPTKLDDVTERARKNTRNVWAKEDLRDILKETHGASTVEVKKEVMIEPETEEKKKSLQEECARFFGLIYDSKDGIHIDKIANEMGVSHEETSRILNILKRDKMIFQPRPDWWIAS